MSRPIDIPLAMEWFCIIAALVALGVLPSIIAFRREHSNSRIYLGQTKDRPKAVSANPMEACLTPFDAYVVSRASRATEHRERSLMRQRLLWGRGQLQR